MKPEFGRTIGQAGPRRRTVFIISMPVQRNIDIIEQARPRHIDFARTAFFRRCAIKPDAARCARFCQPALHGDGGGQRTRAEQIMPAGMAGVLFRQGITVCRCGLADPWQRIIFRQNSDHRAAFAPFRDECRGNARNARLYSEAFAFQLILQQSAGSRFLIAKFGPVPDLLGNAAGSLGLSVNFLQRVLRLNALLCAQRGGGKAGGGKYK